VLTARTQEMRFIHIRILPAVTINQFEIAIREILEDYRVHAFPIRAIKVGNQFNVASLRAMCLEFGKHNVSIARLGVIKGTL
jgi:hypothetical protein